MPDFSLKICQILFRLGLRPRPRWGAYSAPSDPRFSLICGKGKGEEKGSERGTGKGEV